jgi:type II secretory ATPase GspE/PulE/Tfp pilus assembly ATPase PilB-like protein
LPDQNNPQNDGKTITPVQQEQNTLSEAILDINQEFKEREVQQRARDLGIAYIDVSLVPINEDLLRIISEEQSINALLIPFFRVGKKVRVAGVDFEKEETKELVKSLENQAYSVNLNLCSEESLKKAQKAYEKIRPSDKSLEEILQKKIGENILNIEEEIKNISDLPQKFEEVKSDIALAFLHREILATGASDLHFEPQENTVRIRARIDGLLVDFFSISKKIAIGLIRQIKFNAKIKTNTLGIPADGQYTFRAGEKEVMVRVSVIPLKNSEESVVLRFLDPQNKMLEIENLGFLPYDQKKITHALEAREGLVLVTGPTGSGKTTTLYAAIKKINNPERKIITLEDPVEYSIGGVVQSPVEETKGYTFSEGLKSILRQDPDIIMLGEIRDSESAETALQAAITGHFVLSTLHTNSAIESVLRIRNLGIPAYLLSSGIKCIIAQRLVRRVCPHCAEEVPLGESHKKMLVDILRPIILRGEKLPKISGNVHIAKGCEKCGDRGYLGRTVLAEVLEISKELCEGIALNLSINELQKILEKEGAMHTMAQDAAIKILLGVTTFEEVFRIMGANFSA